MSESTIIDPRVIVTAVTMEQVLQHYGVLERLKRAEIYLVGPCPLHKGKDPTEFRVNTARNKWVCLGGCRHGGNVLDFIAIMENITYQAAADRAVAWFKLELKSPAASVKCCA